MGPMRVNVAEKLRPSEGELAGFGLKILRGQQGGARSRAERLSGEFPVDTPVAARFSLRRRLPYPRKGEAPPEIAEVPPHNRSAWVYSSIAATTRRTGGWRWDVPITDPRFGRSFKPPPPVGSRLTRIGVGGARSRGIIGEP